MQPPLVGGHLRAQIERLKQQAIDSRKGIAKPCKEPASLPMEESIIKWIKGLTQTQLSRMYGMSEIIQLAALKGKYKELPAKQMVATALYKCGFDQIRCWKKSSRNRRYWMLRKSA